jgi:hypothetical protein
MTRLNSEGFTIVSRPERRWLVGIDPMMPFSHSFHQRFA